MNMNIWNVPYHVLALAKSIKLLILDADGVMTDGKIYVNSRGEDMRAFNVKDGFGLRMLQRAGINVAIISGKHSHCVESRAHDLNIEHVYLGEIDKLIALNKLMKKTQTTLKQLAYIGDDLPDIAVMRQVSMGIAVADAHPLVIQDSMWKTNNVGGHGAIREVCDLILFAQNKSVDI